MHKISENMFLNLWKKLMQRNVQLLVGVVWGTYNLKCCSMLCEQALSYLDQMFAALQPKSFPKKVAP